MKLLWSDEAWEDYRSWQAADATVFERVNDLINACRRGPFKGIGKPEPLKNDLKGWWSRRVTLDDRLVYRVKGKGVDQVLEIIQCKGHY